MNLAMLVGIGTVLFVGSVVIAFTVNGRDLLLVRLGKVAMAVLVASSFGTMAATTFTAAMAQAGAALNKSALVSAGSGVTAVRY